MPKAREHYTDNNGQLWLKCGKCGEFKTQNEFYKTTGSFLNLTSKCKTCMSKSITERGRNNPEKRKIKDDRYRNNNKEKINKRQKASSVEWNIEHGFNRKTFHAKAYRFMKKNHLIPIKCPICGGNKSIQFHHVSYESMNMWKIGVICCTGCHKKIHSGEIKCPEPINLEEL